MKHTCQIYAIFDYRDGWGLQFTEFVTYGETEIGNYTTTLASHNHPICNRITDAFS
jgi:hypothetical protein